MRFFITITFSLILYSVSLLAQEDNVYKYFEGSNDNMIFYDLTYLHRPFYVFGYERKFHPNKSLAVGFILLNNYTEYGIPLTEMDLGDGSTYRKADGKLNFFLIGSHYFNSRKIYLENSISIGYQLVNFDKVVMNDFFFRKSIFAFKVKDRFYCSLSAQVGYRYIKIREPKYVFAMQQVIKHSFTLHYHIPLIIGFKF
jgi:hypothetical protein